MKYTQTLLIFSKRQQHLNKFTLFHNGNFLSFFKGSNAHEKLFSKMRPFSLQAI